MIKGVRYYSFLGSCGYGEAAISYMGGLLDNGIPLRWTPLVDTRWGFAPWDLLPEDMKPSSVEIAASMQEGDRLVQCLENDIEYDTVILHSVPELWSKLVETGKVNIGYTVWETDCLPQHWPDVLRCVDRICVPCEFNRDMFSIEQGPPVSVVPHAIRRPLKKQTIKDSQAFKAEHEISDDMYIFYIIAAWDPRKAMIETLHAYMCEFDVDDDVCLIIKTDDTGYLSSNDGRRGPAKEIVADVIANYPNPAKVILIAGRIPESQIELIHELGDCFFSLTHCEGWGLGAFDAAVAGNPVIITGWGGQLDFLPVESSYHVKFALKTVQKMRAWESYNSNHHWAYADIYDAGRQLKYVFHNQAEAKEKGLQLQSFVNQEFSFAQVTSALLRAINDAHCK